MKYLKKYLNFFEKRDISSREKITVSRRIVDFLEKYNFKYEGYNKDSNIFVSFKTGDFQTIIPSRKLGGSQYSSPQGFYCFDMNGFKKRLFGDDSISVENFSPDNLSRSSNEIVSLGLGYGNNDNKVESENIWDNLSGIPRYLYFVKIKDGSLILSSNSNSLKFYDPLKVLLKSYSHIFLKDNELNKFDPKDKKDNGLDKKSFNELKNYFTEKKEKYNSNFIDGLLKLLKSIQKDEKNLHVIMYGFLMRCCYIISNDNVYVRFTLLCKSIGIDGFTQRRGEDDYIHTNPKFQTLLLTESCVDDLMKIDLKKELRTDQYVNREKNKINQDEFLKSLKSGDILYDKKYYTFYRFNNSKELIEKANQHNINKNKKNYIDVDNLSKVDLNDNDIWNFIKNIKSGDWIKINRNLDSNSYKKVSQSMIIQINNISNTDGVINFDIKGRIFDEIIVNNSSINYEVGEFKAVNKKYKYNFERKDSEHPLFDPRTINEPIYSYWIENKESFKSKGIEFKDIIDDYYYDEVVNSLEDLFTNKKYQSYSNIVKIYDDMQLLTLLTNFKSKYSERVFNKRNDFNKESMKLYYYTNGDIKKPYRVIDNSNPKF